MTTAERAKACTNCGNHYLKPDPAVPGVWYCPNPNPKQCSFRTPNPAAATVQVQTDNASPEALKTAEAVARATAEAEKRVREEERRNAQLRLDEAAKTRVALENKVIELQAGHTALQQQKQAWETTARNWEAQSNTNAQRAVEAQRLAEARATEMSQLRLTAAADGQKQQRITDLEAALSTRTTEYLESKQRLDEVTKKLEAERTAHAQATELMSKARLADQDHFQANATAYAKRIMELDNQRMTLEADQEVLHGRVAELQSMLDTEVQRHNPTKKHQDGASRRHQEGMTTMATADEEKGIGDRLGDVADEFKDLFIDEASRAAGGVGVDLLVGMTREALHSRGYWPEKLDTEGGRSIAEVIVPATVFGVAGLFPDIPYAKQAKAIAKRGLQAKGQDALGKVIKFFTPQALAQYFYKVSTLDRPAAGELHAGQPPFEEPDGETVDFAERRSGRVGVGS